MALLALLVMTSSLALCAALVPLTKPLARAVGAIDQPGPRKHHPAPTPRLGGVALAVSFLAVVTAGFLVAPRLSIVAWPALQAPLAMLREAPRVSSELMAVLVGATLCFLVGVLDDALGARFPPLAKLAGQVAAAGIVAAGGVRTSFMPQEWMNVALTVVWLVGITNAFNLLDNMDGLAAGVACVASLVFLLNAWLLGELFIVLLLSAFMGGLLGFLVYNRRPPACSWATAAASSSAAPWRSLTLLERYVSHASSTLFPVRDAGGGAGGARSSTPSMVMAVRLRQERRPIYVGDRLHLSHRLVTHGLSPRAAVVFLYLATFFLGLGAVTLAHATPARRACWCWCRPSEPPA